MKIIIKTGLGIACMLSTAAAHHEGLPMLSGSGEAVSYGWPVLVLLAATVLTVGSRRFGRVQR